MHSLDAFLILVRGLRHREFTTIVAGGATTRFVLTHIAYPTSLEALVARIPASELAVSKGKTVAAGEFSELFELHGQSQTPEGGLGTTNYFVEARDITSIRIGGA